MGNFEPHWPRFLHPFNIMIYSNDIFEVFSMGQMGKIFLWGKWVVWIKLPQI